MEEEEDEGQGQDDSDSSPNKKKKKKDKEQKKKKKKKKGKGATAASTAFKILNGLSRPETIKQWARHAEQWRAFNSEEYDVTSEKLKQEAAESFLFLASEER